jgi:hypothetical protein
MFEYEYFDLIIFDNLHLNVHVHAVCVPATCA